MSRRPTRSAEVATDLERRIRDGEFPPYAHLPALAALAEQYSTAENTAATAVKILARRGLVTSVRSFGTIVRDWRRPRQVRRRRAVYRDERGYYFDRTAETWQASAPTRIVWTVADELAAELLGIEVGDEVLVREHILGEVVETGPERRHINPQQIATTYIPADVARVLHLDQRITGPGGFMDRIESEFGQLIFEDVTYARNPTDEEATQLHLGGGDTPLLGIAVIVSDGSGRVVAVNDYRMDARRWMVAHPLHRETPYLNMNA